MTGFRDNPQANEHLVSQCMQEESKLIGQEDDNCAQILKGLDEVLGLPSVCVVVIK